MHITIGRVLAFLAVAAMLALAIWAMMPRRVVVETATVTKGEFVATIDEDGKTRIRERYVVAAPLSGRLSRVGLKVGDEVTAGGAIATLTPSPAPLLDPRSRREAEEHLGVTEASRERSKAAVERAEAEVAQARNEYDRARALTERGVSTQQALERAETARRVAERELRAAEFQDHAAEHEMEQAKALLAQYQDSGDTPPDLWLVTAPVSGLVLKVTQESETIVQPGTPILEIGDPRDLEVVVDVLSVDAVEIVPGAEVAIDNWGRVGMLAGRVRRVEPAAFTKISTLGVEEQRVNVLIDLVSPEKDWIRLGDAYQVDAQITVFSRHDVTMIPTGALFRAGDQWNVYAVANGRVRLRAIQLLRRSGRVAAVSAGLQPGDQVIVYPSDSVADDVRVEAR